MAVEVDGQVFTPCDDQMTLPGGIVVEFQSDRFAVIRRVDPLLQLCPGRDRPHGLKLEVASDILKRLAGLQFRIGSLLLPALENFPVRRHEDVPAGQGIGPLRAHIFNRILVISALRVGEKQPCFIAFGHFKLPCVTEPAVVAVAFRERTCLRIVGAANRELIGRGRKVALREDLPPVRLVGRLLYGQVVIPVKL